MKKLIFLFLTFACFAQPGTIVKTWTMSSFLPKVYSGTQAYYLFDSIARQDSVIEDSVGTNDLTMNGNWSSYSVLADSLTGTSPFQFGGNALHFDSLSYLSIASGSAGDFNPGTSDFSMSAWVWHTQSFNAKIASKRVSSPGWDIYISNTGSLISGVITDGDAVQNTLHNQSTTGAWYYIVWNFDRDGNMTCFRFNTAGTNPRDITSAAGSIAPAIAFTIGAFSNGTVPMKGYLGSYRFDTELRTAKQVAEDWAAATGWVSYSGNLTRDSLDAWYQTFDTDTLTAAIGVDGTLGNNQEWYVTVTAKAKTAADTLDIYFVNKSSTQRKRVGTSWTTFTLPMGDGYNLSATDSIAIGGGSDFDFDNVVISRSTHHLKTPANRGWLGW